MWMDNQGALVTGAARGIGLAIAQRFMAEGARVVMADRDEAALHAAVGGLGVGRDRAVAVTADVSKSADARRLVAIAVESFGRLDVLVNNAGVVRLAALTATPEEIWDEIQATNLKGTYLCSQAALEPMLAHGSGVIINISSGSALTPHPRGTAYAASKAGILAFTRSLAREVGKSGIRVVAVVPGWIATDSNLPNDEDRAWLAVNTSLGRAGRPEEIAGVVAFLAGPDAGFISGQAIIADGGEV